MSAKAEYLIVQYAPDPFRREAKNVGVIVIKDGCAVSRFFGERNERDVIDGRSITWMAYPKVYKRWVAYWKEQLGTPCDDLKTRLMSQNGDNYNIIEGGFVTDTGDDSPLDVCNFLYNALVSPPQMDLLPDQPESEVSASVLKREISGEFRRRSIMGTSNVNLPHPIYADWEVKGKRTRHVPAYFQNNGRATPMDVVDFMTSRKSPVKDHAGWMTTMFADIVGEDSNADPIAIIRAGAEEMREDIVQYALSLLEGTCRIVNWQDEAARNAFYSERERVAHTPHSTG